MRARLAAGGAASGEGNDARTTLVALLATKLLVQNILLSPEVARKYPDLYDQLNKYLDALAAESRADARRETLLDMDALLGAVMGKSGAPAPETVLARSAAPDQQGLMLSILDKLKALLQ
jgi:cytochrome P450